MPLTVVSTITPTRNIHKHVKDCVTVDIHVATQTSSDGTEYLDVEFPRYGCGYEKCYLNHVSKGLFTLQCELNDADFSSEVKSDDSTQEDRMAVKKVATYISEFLTKNPDMKGTKEDDRTKGWVYLDVFYKLQMCDTDWTPTGEAVFIHEPDDVSACSVM